MDLIKTFQHAAIDDGIKTYEKMEDLRVLYYGSLQAQEKPLIDQPSIAIRLLFEILFLLQVL